MRAQWSSRADVYGGPPAATGPPEVPHASELNQNEKSCVAPLSLNWSRNPLPSAWATSDELVAPSQRTTVFVLSIGCTVAEASGESSPSSRATFSANDALTFSHSDGAEPSRGMYCASSRSRRVVSCPVVLPPVVCMLAKPSAEQRWCK